MSCIFISYRRQDGGVKAGRICDRLAIQFGRDQVFFDVNTILSGSVWTAELENALADADILLAVIGPQWLTLTDAAGQRRIDGPADLVRMEIAGALKRDIPVFPVLVDLATLPEREELPEDLQGLLTRQALDVSDAEFDAKMARLAGDIQQIRRTANWTAVARKCAERVEAIRRTYPERGELYYERRAIEDDFAAFLEGAWSAMVIVGQSGMGKSTLVTHLANRYAQEGNLCALVESSHLSSGSEEVEDEFVRWLSPDEPAPGKFWGRINAECVRRAKRLILFIDAVNEYNEDRRGADRPAHLMVRLNDFVWRAHEEYPRIKVVITCRPETWRIGLEAKRSEFVTRGDAYYSGVEGENLPRFPDDEFKRAYEKYKAARDIRTGFDDLSELARYHLRDPFLLNIATETYEHLEIPWDLDTGHVFEKYLGAQKLSGLADTIRHFVAEMFAGGQPGVVQRVAVLRDPDLETRSLSLYTDLNTADQDSPGYKLKERNVLREATIERGGLVREQVPQFRFTYDRLAQYLLSNELARQIDKLSVSGRSRPDASVEVIGANLPGSQRMNVVFGALQRTLGLLGEQSTSADYAAMLRAIAGIDARGLNLVISVLARAARSKDGLQLLTTVLRTFESGGDSASFPIIDAVYRILRDEEYRAWLHERPESERSQHLDLLYGYFHWGFCHAAEGVSAVAVQYVFFLWQKEDSLEDAVAVTNVLVTGVRRLPASLLFPARRRLLTTLAGLMVLLFSEITEEGRATLVLSAARRTLAALDLRHSYLFAVMEMLTGLIGRYLVRVLKNLRNPVNYDELKAYFRDPKSDLADFKRIIEFLTGDCDPADLAPHLAQLSRSRNSFVLQMLTFAMSVAWERSATPESSALCLRLMSELFDAGEPVGEYCSSLALYHINYFGDRATDDSMELMGRMAAHILSVRKGEFALGARTYNFNIVGTYGRALYKNRTGAVLQYAIDGLKQAKSTSDDGFYLYICENIGLLGVLIEPRTVFTVITEILRDLGEIDRSGDNLEPFTLTIGPKARKTVLQSLANIRVLYRQEVDRYLFDALESPGLYDEVANQTTPEFRLATFYSWAFEQLMFRVLTKYRSEIGVDIFKAYLLAGSQKSVRGAVEIFLSRVLRRVRELPA